jgi:hypothetical protein
MIDAELETDSSVPCRVNLELEVRSCHVQRHEFERIRVGVEVIHMHESVCLGRCRRLVLFWK